jgi:hypothetical protein
MEVMAVAFTDAPVEVEPLGRKHPLPGPLAASARVLPLEGVRQSDSAETLAEILLVDPARPVEVTA